MNPCNVVKKTFTECSRNVPLVLNKTYLAMTNIQQTLEKFFGTYDLNYDDIITWKEYHTINQFYKKRVKGERRTFVYIDKNQDWRITTTEFLATKFYKFLSAQAMERIKVNQTHHKVAVGQI